ncbi:MAG: GTPase Obg [Candidatus Tectimicrobiota bacterium]|nr:MAG: GTPase Obg [Candidatus Tectomicrobia bacterium]
MFVDIVKIFVRGGRGGDGCVSFRREKYVPRGGPDGGDGGDGGDVVVQSDDRLHTLLDLRYHTYNLAGRGEHGKGKNQHGKRGADLVIRVPPGTVLRDAHSGELLGDLQRHGERVVVARGGRGGLGNARFATATNRAPRQATRGAAGEERWLLVELKLIADVGLLGFPNAGKSTLISRLSAARPKIADYPFTTLTPHLGVVRLPNETTCVVADIPGIIPGAHEGKGLGLTFLRHVERTRCLVHLVDLAACEDGRSPWQDFVRLNHELACYSAEVAAKPQLVVATKLDLPLARERLPAVQAQFAAHGYELVPISAVTGEGIPMLLQRIAALLALS